jgi:hypothetical protein
MDYGAGFLQNLEIGQVCIKSFAIRQAKEKPTEENSPSDK